MMVRFIMESSMNLPTCGKFTATVSLALLLNGPASSQNIEAALQACTGSYNLAACNQVLQFARSQCLQGNQLGCQAAQQVSQVMGMLRAGQGTPSGGTWVPGGSGQDMVNNTIR